MKPKPTLAVFSVFKKRLHLLKICAIPLIFIFIAIYLFTSPKNIYYSESDILEMHLGLIIGAIGLIYLIVVILVSAIKTYKELDIVKKQKTYFKKQKYPHLNLTIFTIALILIFLRFYFSGTKALMQIAKIFDLLIIIAVIWSLYNLINK